MSAKKRTADRPLYKKYLGAVLLGSGTGLAASAAALCLFALLLSLGGLPGSAAGAFGMAALGAGAFACGFTVSRRLREKGLLMGAVSGIWMFLLCILIGLVSGGVQAGAGLLRGLIFSAAAAAAGGVVGVNLRLRKFR